MENQNDTQTLQPNPTPQPAPAGEEKTRRNEPAYLELMRAPEADEGEAPDATERVLARERRSAWDY